MDVPLLACGVIALGLLLLAVQVRRLARGLDALGERLDAAIPAARAPRKGEPMPPFEAATLDGVRVASAALFEDGRDLLLLFVIPDCVPCREVLAELPAQLAHTDKLVVITTGTPEDNAVRLGLPGGHDVLLQQEQELARRFGLSAVPGALRVRHDGVVASQLAVGRDAILALAGAPHDRAQRRPRISVLP